MKTKQTYLPCRLCGTAAYVPPVVDGVGHEHHQAVCNNCGIEVCRLSEAEVLDIWNRLMGSVSKVSGGREPPAPVSGDGGVVDCGVITNAAA